MFLKPKSAIPNNRGTLYRRFIGIETSATIQSKYRTVDYQWWIFDQTAWAFTKIASADFSDYIPVNVFNNTILVFQGTYFKYDSRYAKWIFNAEPDKVGVELLSLHFGPIARYQLNKYYRVGTFDFMIKGSIEGSTSQYLKGRIAPMRSMNIRTFTDDVTLEKDDLVVVEGKLYSVENPETSRKQQPKPFNIYFATLNNIL